MTTFIELVNQVHSLLHSYCGTQEQITYLTSGVDSDDLNLPVADATSFSMGLVEIEDELMITGANDAQNIVVFPFGRGARGSVAASHSANVMVTFNPTFPRFFVKQAINQCVEALFPQLYTTDSTTFDFVGGQTSYELPADCEQVLKVQWELVGPSAYWQTVGAWEFNQNSPEASGKALAFHEYVQAGRTVRVDYIKRPSQFSANADTFASKGLLESWADLLLYGAAAKLVRFLDSARLQTQSVENLARATVVSAGDAGKIANQFYAMYQQRLQEERRKLLELNPPSIHFTR